MAPVDACTALRHGTCSLLLSPELGHCSPESPSRPQAPARWPHPSIAEVSAARAAVLAPMLLEQIGHEMARALPRQIERIILTSRPSSAPHYPL